MKNRNHSMDDYDKYSQYEARFDPMQTDRQARRKRKPKVKHTPKKPVDDVISELADTTSIEGGFETTYQPGPFEEGWLLQSLRAFFDQDLITDVLGQVKGGKEASVYRCQAHPTTGADLFAAKVYRPRKFRNLRNDKVYRDGRQILAADGRPVQGRDTRIIRAIGKKTAFGAQVQHTSWLMYEYTTLQRLYQAGAAVPEPIAASENAILMSYHGDAHRAAPTLNEIRLEPADARRLYQKVLRNIELMLQHELIHGDLSAYNILYWDGDITLIDFPQVIHTRSNSQAYFILQRDIQRIVDYFTSQGVSIDGEAVFEAFWNRYAAMNPDDQAADLSQLIVEDEEDESGSA